MSLYDELQQTQDKSYSLPKLIDKITIGKNLLTHCTIELTPFCNFLCKFCYARKSPEQMRGKTLFGYDEWKRVIDELDSVNCSFLNITGGECTIHPDFARIYAYAYDKGFSINVFTNGSNITEQIFDLFMQKPPARIFLTMYGNSPEVYATVTGRAEWYETVKNTVRRLAEAKQDVILQGTFTEENLDDMESLYDFAAELGLEYRYSTRLQTYGHCTDELLDEIGAEDARAKAISERIWYKKQGLDPNTVVHREKRAVSPVSPDPNVVGIKCNAGKNSAFINAEGVMMACNTFDAYQVSILDRSINDCFAELNKWACGLKRIMECEGCPHVIHCTTCIAAHYNDTHQLGVPSPRLCYKIREPEKAAAERAFYEEHGYIEI